MNIDHKDLDLSLFDVSLKSITKLRSFRNRYLSDKQNSTIHHSSRKSSFKSVRKDALNFLRGIDKSE